MKDFVDPSNQTSKDFPLFHLLAMGQATQLYKQLLRYGQKLQLTDRNYFYRRVRYVLV